MASSIKHNISLCKPSNCSISAPTFASIIHAAATSDCNGKGGFRGSKEKIVYLRRFFVIFRQYYINVRFRGAQSIKNYW